MFSMLQVVLSEEGEAEADATCKHKIKILRLKGMDISHTDRPQEHPIHTHHSLCLWCMDCGCRLGLSAVASPRPAHKGSGKEATAEQQATSTIP